MTIFSPQKFHQKAKNPRKRPIVTKFVVPKVPELRSMRHQQQGAEQTDNRQSKQIKIWKSKIEERENEGTTF